MMRVDTAPVCPCGARDYKEVMRAERYCTYGSAIEDLSYTLIKCTACGLVRTWPMPEHAEHEPFRDESFLDAYRKRPALYEHYLGKTVGEIARLKPPPGRLLDLGANTGTLVELAAKAGYDATGLELNEAGVEFAKSRGLDVRCTTLDDAGFVPATFDVVSMSAVAEHVPDLPETLAHCRDLLKPAGLLYISNSPNYAGFGARYEKDLWYGIQPTGHVWQYTPKTLTYHVKRAGFRVVSVLKYNLHRDFGRGKKERLRKAAFSLAERLGMGDAVSVGAVK
jgi:2-polyprenyl-3-methyl-5-hydroxy-6-metoxy-1,4-benzoquinol methylase